MKGPMKIYVEPHDALDMCNRTSDTQEEYISRTQAEFEKSQAILEHSTEVESDYWRTLRHQATIAAMQAWVSDKSNLTMMSTIANKRGVEMLEIIIDSAINTANGLIERLKNEAD